MIKNSTRNSTPFQAVKRGAQLLMLLSLILLGSTSRAQVVYNESFTVAGTPTFPVNNLPFGWAAGKYGGGVDPDNYWDRVGVGATSPNCQPRTTNAMVRYRSFDITAGESSFLSSKRLDMRNIPVVGAPVSFWMYRDEGYPGVLDNIRVYVNTTPDMNGTPLQLTATQINRGCGDAPVVTCPFSYNVSGWNQYNFTIPNTYNTSAVYVIILGQSADGNNIYIDDFSVETWPLMQQSFVSADVVYQNSATTAKGRTKQEIIGCRVVVDGYNLPTERAITAMLFNTIGSTSPNPDITAAKVWYTGGSLAFDTLAATLVGTYNNPWTTNYNCIAASGSWTGSNSWFVLDQGENYFWITYDIANGATSGNCVDAEWVSLDYRVTKTLVNGNIATKILVVPDNGGLVAGMVVSGPGIVAGSTITSVVGTTVNISNNLTANIVAGTVNFILTATPNIQTLAGCREIDVIYCVPSMTIGTAWLNYNQNDYVAQVVLAGNATAPPGINNILNSVGPNAGGCAGGPCPFSAHPPDYELFPAVPGKTASLTADGITLYPITLKVGTYCCSNYLAAWIDFNHDGDFNDPGEKLGQSGSLSNGGTYSTTFIVPVTANTGTTRLRVREVYAQPNIDPCASYYYGETEDYVVTLLPTCGVPGWRTWLGFTNDWDNPANWCGGVPTIADNARLPGSGNPGYTRPVIKPGVFATAKKLRIEPDDTLYIRAWNNSSLTVADSMYIQGPTSAVKVISQIIDTAQVYNGQLLPSTAFTPLKNSTKSRSFWLFSQSELLARGLVAGDVITDLMLHLERKLSNNAPYRNVSIKYYYTTPAFVFVPGLTASIPPVAIPGTEIYANVALYVQTLIPGTYGTLTFPVTGSFIWSGTTNKLVIELSYDNLANTNPNSTGAQPKYTQTLGYRHYATITNTAAMSIPGADLVPNNTQVSSGAVATNTVTVTDALNIVAGQTVTGTGIPAGATVTGVAGNVVTLSANLTANITNGILTFQSAGFWTTNDYRPNLTFKFDRPFKRYEIEVRGQWGNNGSFTPGFSRVTMKGGVVQNIAGASNTTFFDFKVDNPNHVVRQTDFTVTDTLLLNNGRLKLNNGLVTLTNPDPAALSRLNGFLQSDQDIVANNVGPYGRFHWNLGSTPGAFRLPYINAGGSYIPMDYVTTAGTHDVIFATHGTAPSNIPTPVAITNINGYFTGTDNSINMVDRYYMIDNTAGSAGATADVTFRYSNPERAAGGNVLMRAQRWMAPSAGWEYPFLPSQTFTAAAPDIVSVPAFNQFSSNIWWTITQNANPLPVSMLDFTAKTYKDKVKLSWQTASEVDNSHFIVERTVNNDDFDFIGRVESRGPSNNTLNYSTWDEQPLEGMQYYYLRQYDYNGALKSYGPVSATFSKDLFEIVTATAISSEKGLIVEFDYNSAEPFKYTVVDMLGKVIAVQDKNTAQPGRNRLEIDVKLSQGVYQIMLQNSEKLVSKKFYFDKL